MSSSFVSENDIWTAINFHSSSSYSGIICLSLFSSKYSMAKCLGKPADENILFMCCTLQLGSFAMLLV